MERKELKNCPRLILPRWDEFDTLKDIETAYKLERATDLLRSIAIDNKDIQLDAIIDQLQKLLDDTLSDFVFALLNTAPVDELIEHPRKGGAE